MNIWLLNKAKEIFKAKQKSSTPGKCFPFCKQNLCKQKKVYKKKVSLVVNNFVVNKKKFTVILFTKCILLYNLPLMKKLRMQLGLTLDDMAKLMGSSKLIKFLDILFSSKINILLN